MTKREQERLTKLLEKKEREEQADKDFFTKVRRRKAEVLKVLKVDESELNILQADGYEDEIAQLTEQVNSLEKALQEASDGLTSAVNANKKTEILLGRFFKLWRNWENKNADLENFEDFLDYQEARQREKQQNN